MVSKYAKLILTGWICLMATGMWAQKAGDFIQPFDFPIKFAGNFGEIRSNHFHGGLDFKTDGEIGKEVHALADGYICRIRVTVGSGLVLDVRYQNGITTINRHLSQFRKDIQERVEALQYKNESYEIEINPRETEYPVKQGDVIALSGNTGYSSGPHLHLDMYETQTDDFVDPLPFFLSMVKDSTAPRAEGFMLFPQIGKGVVNGGTKNVRVPLRPGLATAWGKIGVGLKAFDYMEGVANRYGVKFVTLTVDSVEVFNSVIDRFSENENLYINSWTKNGYMKSFVEPGNKLRLLHPMNKDRGLITIDQERPYHLVYTLKDAFGNTSTVKLTIVGKKQPIPQPDVKDRYVLKWNKGNLLSEMGMELAIPQGCLYDDVYMNFHVTRDSSKIAYTYQLTSEVVKMHKPADLSIKLVRKPMVDTSKYYIRGTGGSAIGRYEDGTIHARITQLGTYTVAIDTVPPAIRPISQQLWGRRNEIMLSINDGQTGVDHYRAEVDGKFIVLGQPNSMRKVMTAPLTSRHVKKGGRHTLKVVATDSCGNTKEQVFSFIW